MVNTHSICPTGIGRKVWSGGYSCTYLFSTSQSLFPLRCRPNIPSALYRPHEIGGSSTHERALRRTCSIPQHCRLEDRWTAIDPLPSPQPIHHANANSQPIKHPADPAPQRLTASKHPPRLPRIPTCMPLPYLHTYIPTYLHTMHPPRTHVRTYVHTHPKPIQFPLGIPYRPGRIDRLTYLPACLPAYLAQRLGVRVVHMYVHRLRLYRVGWDTVVRRVSLAGWLAVSLARRWESWETGEEGRGGPVRRVR